MPLNHNGKLDRSALPAPTRQDGAGAAYVAPGDPTEEALARIWSQVLGIERVGTADDYFALGGDSLNSLRIVARMRTAFGVEVTPRDLFEEPTIAALAATIRDRILAGVLETAAGTVLNAPDRPSDMGERTAWNCRPSRRTGCRSCPTTCANSSCGSSPARPGPHPRTARSPRRPATAHCRCRWASRDCGSWPNSTPTASSTTRPRCCA
ncbi:phosphopantetheine-binding protein [Streptacidiphilus sp. P02-A3a]|uniref:phosphopantetheine-binding protein n=1 Tax=Streptacidiphilus sp. P02-A3a TaxID=2704468 RepID=UPI001CDB9480